MRLEFTIITPPPPWDCMAATGRLNLYRHHVAGVSKNLFWRLIINQPVNCDCPTSNFDIALHRHFSNMSTFNYNTAMQNWNDLISDFKPNPAPEIQELSEFVRIMAVDFPADYYQFLQSANGGSGEVGGRFIRFDNLTEILANTRAHGLYSKKLIHLGSDGGEVAYCLSFKQKPYKFVSLGYYETRSKALGVTFAEMLTKLALNSNSSAKPAKSKPKPKASNIASQPTEPVDGLVYELKHKGSVVAMSVSPDGKQLLTADDAQHTYLWDLQTGEKISAKYHARVCHRGARFTTAGQALAIIDRDLAYTNKALVVYDQVSEQPIADIEFGLTSWGNGDISPDGQLAMFFKPHDEQAFWSVATGRRISELPRQTNKPFVIAFSPDSQFFLLGCGDNVLPPGRTHQDGYEQLAGEVLVYDRHGTRIGQFRAHEDRIIALAVADDGRILTASSSEVRIWPPLVWNTKTAASLRIAINLQMVTAVTFVAGGKRFAVATYAGDVRVYDSHTGNQLHVFVNRQDAGGLLSATPDGKMLITAQGEDAEAKAYKFARVWRLPE